MMKKYRVIIWFDDRIDVGSHIISAETKDDACVKAMMAGNYGKDY